jgi:hypothetical protein
MARRKTLQTNFSAGELAPGLEMRQDTEQYQNGAKSLLNRRCMIGGGTKRRPGSLYLADLPGTSRIEEWVVNETTLYAVIFSDTRMDAYSVTIDGSDVTVAAAGSITGAPWDSSIVAEMQVRQSGNTMFVVHPDMEIQVIARTGAATWSRAAISYEVGPASRPEQPYLKFVDADVTLQPSALTGSITLTASESVFVAGHIGSYVRYVEKSCLITAVAANGLSCTATVIETLPDTQDLTVTSSASFAVGEIVEGGTSSARGLITSIPDATSIFVVILDGLTPFAAETLVGPNASTAISSVASAGTKAAVVDWDEQMFGPVYGYPGTVEIHRNRLLFAGHPEAPDYLVASATGNLYDFNVGDGSDTDAIIESVGDAGASRIVQLYSAEQLLVATDNGLYYVPETATAPFRPSSMAFFPFGSKWPITATARAQSFDNGVLFVSGSLVIKARPTGDLSRQWEADEVSLLAHHMIDNPTEFAVTSNFGGGPERYAIFRNEDGTLAVMQLVEKQNIRNFTPWVTDGIVQSIAALRDQVLIATRRTIAGNTKYLFEIFDQDVTLDAATEYATEALMDAGIPTRYGGTEVNVVVGTQYHLGTYPIQTTTVPEGPYVVGIYYDSEIETLPPVIDGPEGPLAGDYMRILECYAHVIGSQRFAADGFTLAAYQVSDDVDEPPPVKNGPQRFQFLGWEREPTILFNQPDPLPLEVLAVKQTVAW